MILGLTGNIGCGKDTVAKMIQYYFAEKKSLELYKKMCELTLQEFLSGKNIYSEIYKVNYTITESISNDSGWKIKKFAGKLKQIAALLVGCSESDFESQEFKDKLLPDEWQVLLTDNLFEATIKTKRTYRWMLQQLGTEAIRNNIHRETWINALMCDYKCGDKVFEHPKGGISMYPNWIISDVRFINEAKSIKDRNGIIIKIARPTKESNSTHDSETELSKIIQDYTIENNGTIEDLYDKVEHLLDFLIKNNQLA